MNEAAEAYLDYYLSQPDTSFAVLLEGRWGSGKTYFLNRYMAARAKKADPVQKGKIHLYVSLNGVTSPNEITQQFFAQTAPLLAGKTVGLLSIAVARIANGFSGGAAFDTFNDSKKIQEYLTNLDGKILVFDDLERCRMPLGEALGFINNYVEHDKRKVILLAAENEIDGDSRKEYLQRKEKLVGKTLRVGSDAQSVYEFLVERMHTSEAKSQAQAAGPEAVRTFKASGIENFRSLRAIMDDFDRLVGEVDEALANNPKALTQLLVMMIALGMEHRSGALETDEVAKFNEGRNSELFASLSGRRLTDQEQKLTAIAQKYADVSWDDPVVPMVALADLFASGSIDVASIDSYLLGHPLIADPAEIPAWRRLWSWRDLTQTDYADARRAFLHDLNTRAYTSPAVILHAAGVVRALHAANDQLLGRRNIAKYFAAYVNDVVANGTLESAGNLFDFDPTGAFGLGFNTVDEPGFDDIKSIVRKGVDKAVAAKMVTEAPVLMRRLQGSRDAYSALYEYGHGPDNYGTVAVLAEVPVHDFASLLVTDGRPNDNLFASLVTRYERASALTLAVEEAWVSELRNALDKVVAKASQPHRHLLGLRVEHYFGRIGAAFVSMKARAQP